MATTKIDFRRLALAVRSHLQREDRDRAWRDQWLDLMRLINAHYFWLERNRPEFAPLVPRMMIRAKDGGVLLNPDSDYPAKLIAELELVADNLEERAAPHQIEQRYMPAEWFRKEFGIDCERLRSAERRGQIRARRVGRRVRYSVPDVCDRWPEDVD